jgi:hypothetical protein
MAGNSWQSVLVSAQVDGTALGTSTTETSILPGQAKFTLPANYVGAVGFTLRGRAMGRVSTLTAAPGTLTFRVKFGSIAVGTTGALALNTTAKTNVTWILDFDLTVRAVGASTTANAMFSGAWQSEAVIASPAAGAGGAASHIFPATAPAVGTGFDSTVSNVVDLTAQWSVSNAANTIQLHTYKLESLN